MASFAFTVISLGGTALTGAPYQVVFFRVENGPLGTRANNPVYAGITGKGSRRVRGQPQPSTFRLRVALSALQQSDLKTAHAVFNETDGAVYLRVTDGDGVVWRLECAVRNVEPISTNLFDVVLDVPDQVWETDTAVTDNQSNKTASPIALGAGSLLTNAGDRDTAPVFTINVDASKSINSALDDYAFALATIMVNRSPNDLDNVPVWLFDASGAASRLATNTSAAGATVIQTTGATSITANIVALDTTIALTSAAGFNANGGLGWITDSRGAGFHENFYYTGKAGNVLQGVVWLAAAANGGSSNPTGALQTAGGIAHTIAQVGANISPSGVMLSGDDCRVTLDDVPNINRWLVNWNAAASDVCIVASFKRAVPLTMTAAMTASVPATGSSFSVKESMALLPQADFYVMVGDEVIYIATRDDHTCYGIVRGAWGTTAAIHATTATVYPNPRRAIVQAGYAKAGAPPCPPAERPCMQIKGSSNQTWKYGDQSDDDQTIYYDPLNPNRASMWVPGFDLDGNTVSPLMSLSAYGNILTFKDDVTGDGSPPYNNLELTVPMGLKTGDANAIKNDWTPTIEILNLELFTRDAASVLKLQDQLQQSAPAAARALPAALTNIAYGVKLKARYNIATGHRGTGGAAIQLDGAQTAIRQHFTLTKETIVTGFQIYGQLLAPGTQTIFIRISDNSQGVAALNRAHVDTQSLTVTDSTPQVRQLLFEKPVKLPAGTHCASVTYAVLANGFVLGNRANRYFIAAEYGSGGTAGQEITTQALWFAVLTAYLPDLTVDIETDQPVTAPTTGLRTATTASFDKTELILSTTQSLYVHRISAFVNGASAGNMHHLKGTIASTTTGESGVLDVWVRPNGIVTIDCDARTIVKTEDTIDTPIGSAFSGSFITLPPGDSTVTYADVSLKSPGQIDIQTLFRSRKA